MNWLIIAAIAAFGIGAALLWVAWWLWWRLPRRQVERLSLKIRDPKARADVEDNFRKTVTQLFNGILVLLSVGGALLAAGLAYYGTQQTLRVSEKSARELLISNQVSKGFEQLGSGKIVERLGGIYALEGVMNTSEQYQQPVLEALSAFVRDRTKTDNGDGPPTTDIQAALTVIGRRTGGPDLGGVQTRAQSFEACTRLAEIGRGGPDLGGAHIPIAKLLGRANEVGGANEAGRANLACARLEGVNLTRAVLNANLTGAWLFNANLANAVLPYANLTGAWLMKATLVRADLTDANLTDADLTDGAAQDGVGADLSDATLNGADLSHADLRAANLRGAKYSAKTIFPPHFDRKAGMISD